MRVLHLDDVSEQLVDVPVGVQHSLPLGLDAHALTLDCRSEREEERTRKGRREGRRRERG